MLSDLAELVRDAEVTPDGWRVAPFSALADYVNGRAFKPEDWGKEGLPIIRIAQITNPDAETNFFDGAVDPRNLIDDDDLIFSWSATLAVMRWRKGPAVLNQHLFKVTPAEGIDRDWLQFRLEASIPDLADEAHGTTMKHIRKGTLSSQSTIVPPLDEQRRIAEVLRSVDEAIAAAEAVATSMFKANKTMRHELLKVAPDGTLSDLPHDWSVVPLEALASVERGKFSVRPRNDPRYFGGSTPFIQTGDITAAGDYITRHTQTLNDLGVGVSRVFPAGTIMTTIAANIGDFAIASYPVACPDSVVGIAANADVDQFWLYSVLCCFKAALDRAATQNAQKNINLQTLRPLQVPVPPRALMLELAETLSAAADGARQAKASVANLTTMKQSIMSDLLSGRVRVPA